MEFPTVKETPWLSMRSVNVRCRKLCVSVCILTPSTEISADFEPDVRLGVQSGFTNLPSRGLYLLIKRKHNAHTNTTVLMYGYPALELLPSEQIGAAKLIED